ncbi:MAG TPA: MerR family transcriptional regulator [Candidatus Polarisedimenticolaceae bacterium]|nr:MerR family transcriptional regulator [Candidatus Polarisedimenticolaceae bacterium]
MSEIPDKSFYKVNEVCQYTDTQPYVLRFWESEFPQLAPHKNKTGQRVYTRRDLDLIMRIKRLLHDEEYTIASARARLDEEDGRSPVSFLPDGEPPESASSAAAALTSAPPTLFEAEPPRAAERAERARAEAADMPHAISALETPFIPAPPVTDPTHLRQELRAERERADALHAKLEQLRREQDAAGQEQEAAQRTIENQRQMIASLKQEHEAAQARAARLDAAEAALAELQSKSGDAGRLQKDLLRLEETLADTRAALETERETLVHERAAADALRGRLHALEASAAEVRSRLDAAEGEAQRWRERAQRASMRVAEVASALRSAAGPSA